MNVQSIANDYDARRAGEAALDEIVKIARKSGTIGISRR
jgi:DNA-directed RNA polymerase subunit H (RpoH/RPB5)